MDLQAFALVPAQLSLTYIHTEFLYMSESKHHLYFQSSMMKGPSMFELSLEASCWWMKIKSVVKRRWVGNGCLSSCFNILRLEFKTGTGKQGSGHPTRSRI